ncbi:MAG: helix-turn-helix domain-containing protein [Lachnospiraceae bacterium]|nr:helix-turn-helix domain-containing protein [Lachnospiraceae bacterium]
MLQISEFCDLFYASHYVPIACCSGDTLLYSAGYLQGLSAPSALIATLRSQYRTPAVTTTASSGMYGLICPKDEDYELLLGPVYGSQVTSETMHAFLRENALPAGKLDEVSQFLSNLPQYTYHHFLYLLLYLELVFNGEAKSAVEHFGVDDMKYERAIAKHHASNSYDSREEGSQHGTYTFEQQMLNYIRHGETAQLKSFLLSATRKEPLREGRLADTPLRQIKNRFIGTVALVGKTAAIPGGLDVEQTYQLIDHYTVECEQMTSIDAVSTLQYNMLIDFSDRVAACQLPEGISREVHSCVQFIWNHINEPIGLPDIASHIGRSKSYITTRFAQEMHTSIAAYITKCKTQEAKNLLRHTDKPLSEIASYLSFSTQSYFQKVFKQQTGLTPLQYRKTGSHFKKEERMSI